MFNKYFNFRSNPFKYVKNGLQMSWKAYKKLSLQNESVRMTD